MDLCFSLVGPGKVGTSLARWLVARGGRLESVAARRPDAASVLADELEGEAIALDVLDSSAQDLLLVAVSDSALAEVTQVLSGRGQATVALHPSGSLGSEILAPLRRSGTHVGGLHPLRAFPTASGSVEDAAGIVFAVGGDPSACALAIKLIKSWEGIAVTVPDDARILYHLAASLAAGGVVSLLAAAKELATIAGLSRQVVHGYLQLAHQALDQAEEDLNPAAVITGPIARGDTESVERQIQALEARAPETLELLVALSRATLRQRDRIGRPPENLDEIRSILCKVMERKSFLDRK